MSHVVYKKGDFPSNLKETINGLRIFAVKIPALEDEELIAAVDQLPERDKTIILKQFQEKKTLTEIAPQIQLSVERTRQLRNRALVKLRKQIIAARQPAR